MIQKVIVLRLIVQVLTRMQLSKIIYIGHVVRLRRGLFNGHYV